MLAPGSRAPTLFVPSRLSVKGQGLFGTPLNLPATAPTDPTVQPCQPKGRPRPRRSPIEVRARKRACDGGNDRFGRIRRCGCNATVAGFYSVSKALRQCRRTDSPLSVIFVITLSQPTQCQQTHFDPFKKGFPHNLDLHRVKHNL